MTLRNKIIFSAAAMLLLMMISATVAVSIIINRQNRNASYDYIDKSFNIIKDDINRNANKLLSDTRQLTTIDEMGFKVKYLLGTGKDFEYKFSRDTYTTIATSMFNVSARANAATSAIYGFDGNLISFFEKKDDQVTIGWIHQNDIIETGTFTGDEQPSRDSWHPFEGDINIPRTFTKAMAQTERLSFELLDGTLCITAISPILGEAYNTETEQMEMKQYGVVRSVYPLNHRFVTRMTELVGIELNIFSTRNLLSGSIEDYLKPYVNESPQTGSESDLMAQPVHYMDVTINGQSYFQGTLSVFAGDTLLGYIASLQSTEVAKANTLQMIKYLIMVFFICFLLLLPLAIVFSRRMTRPIAAVVSGLQDVAEGEGDLTKRLTISTQDEVGDLGKWFNIFMEKLQVMIRSITQNTTAVTTSVGNLLTISTTMSENSDQISHRSENVAASTTQMSSNIDSVAAAMEEASTNITMVAGAADELNGTISEIAQNSEKARRITGMAVSQAENTSQMIAKLGDSAEKIGKVTETIEEISEQTNLLALNATIEAARAGEAGKGFSVVANEIKELARQTASATQEIKEKISAIQGSTSGTIQEIASILKIINDADEIVGSIATAVEEQSVTTKEIANNVAQASTGIAEVNENLASSNMAASNISTEISMVSSNIGEISGSSTQVNTSATELKKLSEILDELVKRFKI